MAGSGSKLFMNLGFCTSQKSWERMQGRISGSLCKMVERDRVIYRQDGASIYLFTVCSLKHYRWGYEPTHTESGQESWLTACQATQGTHLSRLGVLYHPGKHHWVFSLDLCGRGWGRWHPLHQDKSLLRLTLAAHLASQDQAILFVPPCGARDLLPGQKAVCFHCALCMSPCSSISLWWNAQANTSKGILWSTPSEHWLWQPRALNPEWKQKADCPFIKKYESKVQFQNIKWMTLGIDFKISACKQLSKVIGLNFALLLNFVMLSFLKLTLDPPPSLLAHPW